MQFLLGVLGERLVWVEEAGAFEDTAVPAVHAVAEDGRRISSLGNLLSSPDAVRSKSVTEPGHPRSADFFGLPPVMLKLRRSFTVFRRARSVTAPAPLMEAMLRERLGRADVRLPQALEEDPQHRVGVGDGTDRGADVGAHPLLVDDDGRQPFQYVDIRPRQRRRMKPWTKAL